MTLVVADSGGSKTDWLASDGRRATTCGLNPRVVSADVIAGAARQALADLGLGSGCGECAKPGVELHFYGAGCGTEAMQAKVAAALRAACPEAAVVVEGDMLGACRAICGDTAGSVAILGTGSNICRYDGQRLVDVPLSGGYLLADEGSGCHIGRRLVADFVAGLMPQSLAERFEQQFGMATAQWVEHLYQSPTPNRAMASAAQFAGCWVEHQYVKELLAECFGLFFVRHRAFFARWGGEVGFVGGVVQAFAEPLAAAARQAGVNIVATLGRPADRILAYHLKKTQQDQKYCAATQ